MSDFHRDTPEWLQHLRTRHNDDRFQQLNELFNSYVMGSWTYLLAVNGGGAAGMLAFIGAKESIARMEWPYWVLMSFVFGLICVGMGHVVLVHKASAMLDNWNVSMQRYWKNEMPWSSILKRDDESVAKLAWLPWLLGWSSLIFFLAGIFFAAWNFKEVALGTA